MYIGKKCKIRRKDRNHLREHPVLGIPNGIQYTTCLYEIGDYYDGFDDWSRYTNFFYPAGNIWKAGL